MTTQNTPASAAPNTIVLVHGFWVTPISWEKWVERYEGKGYRVLTPTYPGFEGGVEALREDPSPIEALTFPAIIEHIGGIIDELDMPPIIIGHSAGGVLTQILLDHGYGAAGVAIDSVPAEGVGHPRLADQVALPDPKNPANRHKAFGFTPEQFHYAFANTVSREESDEVYERYHIPASGRLVWVGATANFTPGHQENYVDQERGPGALAVHRGGRGQHHAALGQPVQRQALPLRQEPHRLQGVRGTLSLQRDRGQGWRRSQTTPWSGPRRTRPAR